MKSKSFFSIRFCLSVILLFALALTPLVQLSAGLEARAKTTTEVKAYSSKPTKEALKWANKELRRMSLDEKIGQLICVGINATFLNQDSDAFKALSHQVEDNHIGGMILFRGPVYESVVLVNRMQQLAHYAL